MREGLTKLLHPQKQRVLLEIHKDKKCDIKIYKNNITQSIIALLKQTSCFNFSGIDGNTYSPPFTPEALLK